MCGNGAALCSPESAVCDTEGLCLPFCWIWLGLPVARVFADAQKEIEGYVDEVCRSLVFGGGLGALVCRGEGKVRECHRHSQLWGNRGVLQLVAFQLLREVIGVSGGGACVGGGVGGVWLVCQLEALADCAKGVLYCSSADLMSFSCASLSNEMGKGPQEFSSLWVGDPLEKWVHVIVVAERGPSSPIAGFLLGSLIQCAIGCVSSRIAEHTSEVKLLGNRSIFHELSCVSGKREL